MFSCPMMTLFKLLIRMFLRVERASSSRLNSELSKGMLLGSSLGTKGSTSGLSFCSFDDDITRLLLDKLLPVGTSSFVCENLTLVEDLSPWSTSPVNTFMFVAFI